MQAQGPLPVGFLVNNLHTFAELDYFDGHYDQRLRKEIGSYHGMFHGGVFSPSTGMLRSDITVLATLEGVDTMRGYNIGREWYLVDAEPH
jgi:hypothetical protein